jgi:hypothetical protein
MPLVKYYCEICREWIGKIDPDTIHLPLTSDQFKPIIDHFSQVPPFHEKLTWEWFQCPVCHKRPFIDPHKLYTERGFIDLPDPVVEEKESSIIICIDPPREPDNKCEVCGMVCKSKIGLISHKRKHKDGK